MGSKKKTVVVTSDPLALITEKTKVSKSKEKVVVSSDSEGSSSDDFNYEYYKTKMLLAKKDKDEQVLLAEDQAWMESSSDSDQEINANMVFMAQIKKVLLDSEASSSSADEKISKEINANMVFMAQIEKVLSKSDESSSSVEENIDEVAYYTSESEKGNNYIRTYKRDIIVYGRSQFSQNIQPYFGMYDPLSYVLFFPNGEPGWHQKILRVGESMDETADDDENIDHCLVDPPRTKRDSTWGKVATTVLVDVYIKIETSRVGQRVVLPASFIGGPHDMRRRFLDAMKLVQDDGKPDIFLTMTCNLKWPEILEAINPGQEASDRPDVVARVFRAKLEDMKDQLFKRHVLGVVGAYVYIVEFQKRGLPHAHFLLIMTSKYKMSNPEHYDKMVCGEIPDPTKYPIMHEMVVKHMMHDPCGHLRPSSPCMEGMSLSDFNLPNITTNMNLESVGLREACGRGLSWCVLHRWSWWYGKNILYKVLLAEVCSRGLIALATASSGVASNNMLGGRTSHSRFKIPINLNNNSMCNITKQSGLAELLRLAKLIIWDEAKMAKRQVVDITGIEEAIDGSYIRIPDDMAIPYTNDSNSRDDLINAIFPSLETNAHSSEYIISSVILSTKNDNVDEINDQLIGRFHREEKIYYSFDKAEDDNNNFYPMEFLNSLNVSGLPPHYLRLKIGCPTILLRNIDLSNRLCNGTRLIRKGFQSNVNDAEIVVGQHAGKRVFLPRIPLCPSEDDMFPFKLKRKQFPVRLSFAMTINKDQGQTIPNVGVYLPDSVFSHGQLYVALSRGISRETTKVLVRPTKQFRHDGVYTSNVV
nr:hypothetical protein [Tanacetum cinerariifolium]